MTATVSFTGITISHYGVLEKDTRLGRSVALKLLPDDISLYDMTENDRMLRVYW